MFILSKVAIVVVYKMRRSNGRVVFNPFGSAARIDDPGQPVGACGIVKIVRQLIDVTVGAGRHRQAPPGIGFDISIQVVCNGRLGIIISKSPRRTGMRIMAGSSHSVGRIVGKPVLVAGTAGAIDIGPPLQGGNISVVHGRTAVGRALILESGFEQVGQVVTRLDGSTGNIIYTSQPVSDVIGIVE